MIEGVVHTSFSNLWQVVIISVNVILTDCFEGCDDQMPLNFWKKNHRTFLKARHQSSFKKGGTV